MAEHTKGPWIKDFPGKNTKDGYRIYDHLQRPVALVYFPALRYDQRDTVAPAYAHEAKANARLIAAAPDLLAACEHLTSLADRNGWHDYAVEGQRAIARAVSGA